MLGEPILSLITSNSLFAPIGIFPDFDHVLMIHEDKRIAWRGQYMEGSDRDSKTKVHFDLSCVCVLFCFSGPDVWLCHG